MESKCLCLTMINNLPPSIIDTILSLVTLKEAARTSVLCKEWRYHWTNHPNLDFVANAVRPTNDHDLKQQANLKLINAINQLMSARQHPIHHFSLSTYADGPCLGIDRIIGNLSRDINCVKKLTLDMSGYSLPQSLFSLRNLTHLHLNHCHLDVPPTTFTGFGGTLESLYMENVIINKQMLLLFLSSCPLLKTVILNPCLGRSPSVDDFTVVELFECLPMIETLTVNLPMLKYFGQGRVPNKLPAALVHLKYLCIRELPTVFKYRVPCCAFLIRSCPNLEKLKIKVYLDLYFGMAGTWESYSDIWLEHLNELEVELWTKRGYRLHLVKLILAKSPRLKKLKILLWNRVTKDEELRFKLEFYEIFLQSPRASPVVEIIVERGVKMDRKPFNLG